MTRAILLSAGRGERMRPLTDNIPKPLIPLNGKPLIVYHLEKLAAIGVTDVVINISYLANQIRDTLGDGKRFNLNIIYSHEPEVLETGGGIIQALPSLGSEPFLVISADIFTDYPFEDLLTPEFLQRFSSYNNNPLLAHLILVPNPDWHTTGDFSMGPDGLLSNIPGYTYASMGLFHPDFFKGSPPGKQRLGPMIRDAIEQGQVSGSLYNGLWYNIGTTEELQKVEKSLIQQSQ